jgi:hypothetical protein
VLSGCEADDSVTAKYSFTKVGVNGNNVVGTLLVEERNPSLVSCWEKYSEGV